MELTPTTNDTFIAQELARFDATEAELAEFANGFKELSIAGIDDKEGLKCVHDARIKLKSRRVEIQKKGKSIRDSALAFQKAVIARENALIEILAPVEKSLQAQEDAVEEAKEAIRQEAERKESARIQDRLDALQQVNTVADFHTVKGMTDEQFDAYLNEATASFRIAEANAILEKKILEAQQEAEKARQEQIAKDLQAEGVRLKKIADEQARIQADQEAKQKALDDERQAFEEAKAKEAAEKKRLEELEKAKEEARLQGIRDEENRRKQEEFEKEQARLREEERKAEAPDKEKVKAFALSISTVIETAPVVHTAKHRKNIAHALEMLNDIIDLLTRK